MERRLFLLSSLAVAAPAGKGSKVMEQVAEAYVKLVLAVGQHDQNYVDAYYGPKTWQAQVQQEKPTLSQIGERSAATLKQLEAQPVPTEELGRLRHEYLRTLLRALQARVAMLGGRKFTFDEESKALYDAVAPVLSEDHFRKLTAQLDPLLPGSGPLAERYQAYLERFTIPVDRLDKVFTVAIDEARRRTKQHITLPANESFTVEYVKDKVWSAYNWYQGGSRSVIQVNTSLPIDIGFALHLACHEGYPGHHVYNALLEQELVKERGFAEFQVYPLYSPQSLIAEGTAEYGVGVAFPGQERVAFVREKLFPLAGLDAKEAETFFRVKALAADLSYAGNEAARNYLDGKWDRPRAEQWLRTYALMSPERAKQRIGFMETHRAYVINYNLGQDLAKKYIEQKRGAKTAAAKWKELAALLSSPRLPSGL